LSLNTYKLKSGGNKSVFRGYISFNLSFLPIIVAVFGSNQLFIFLATLTKPNIDIIPNEKDPSKSSIKFSNTGIEAATHMNLKIKYLKTFAIILVFSSENITFEN
jgi:hypothetical protein